jgi:catecholate siderophore receptor
MREYMHCINTLLKYKSLLFILFLITGLAFTTQINAQYEIEEVIVEGKILHSDKVLALKTPVPIINVPQSLSIFTEKNLKNQGLREISDIVRYSPGVNSSQGEGHRDSVVFRGVRSTADFFLDGLRDDVQYYRSFYNIEQVEILRGPNALLFGRGGTGGIINRVTKKAELGSKFGSVDFAFDSFGASDITLDYNVNTNSDSAFRFMMHVDSLENHRDHYDGNRLGINPTYTRKLSDKTTIDLSYEFIDHERFIDRGIPTINGRPDRSLEDVVFGGADVNTTTVEASIFRGNLTHEISDTSKAIFTIQSSDFEKMYRNYYASGYDGALVTMDGYLDPTERQNLIISSNFVNELQIGNAVHTILVGAEMIDTENENFRYNTFWSTTSDDNEIFNITRPMNFGINSAGVLTTNDFAADLNNQTTSDIEVTSLYIQDQIDFSEKWKLMIGGRVDNFDITVVDVKADSSQSRDDSEFSPRGGIIFKARENMSLYWSYSESFLPRSGEQYKKLDANAARLDPDVFENSEFGLKWDISDALSMTLSKFDSKQVRASYDNDTGESAEIRGTEIDGLELEIKGKVHEKLYIAFGYTNLNGETSSGGKPRELPGHTLSLWAMYNLSDNFGYALGVTHQGESNIKDNNSALVLPGYSRIDFAAFYNLSSDVTVRLNVENLTDKLYFPHSHSTHQVSVGEPLNARLSITKKF